MAVLTDLPDDDGDSGFVDDLSSLETPSASVLDYHEENGRTYNALNHEYHLPNDEDECSRLDFQHELYRLTTRDLASCPKNAGANRVLDIGTGTGIWAIDYAAHHPEAEAIGVDLSPIQPAFVPPNCTFELDDVKKQWTWTRQFDFIHAREVAISPDVMRKCYDQLEPGGYLEIRGISLSISCDDGTLPPGSILATMCRILTEAAREQRRDIDCSPRYEGMFIDEGFVDTTIKRYRWPINNWPKTRHYKYLGIWSYINMDEHVEGLCLRLLTGAGWEKYEVLVLCDEARKELKNTGIHAYWPVYVCYGKKPEKV